MPDGKVTSSEIFRLLADVGDEASRREANACHVVSVVLDDVESHWPLIVEACRHRYGRLPIVAPNVETVSEVNPQMRRVIEDLDLEGEKFEVAEVGADAFRVRPLGVEDEPLNEGTKAFLGLLTALLDPELNGQDVVVLRWNEADLDAYHREAAWRIVAEIIPGSRPIEVGTVVAFIQVAKLDYGRHCASSGGARFVSLRGSVSTQRTGDPVLADINWLASGTAPLVLFLGAGASASSELPLGDELRDFALRAYVGDDGTPAGELAVRFHKLVDQEGRLLPEEIDLPPHQFVSGLTLERVLREEANRNGAEASPTLTQFAGLNESALQNRGESVLRLQEIVAALQRRLVIVTVNFDTLLEDHQDEYFKRYVSAEEFESLPSDLARYVEDGGAVPLLKIHGTIDRRETIVANVDRTGEGLPASVTDALLALSSMGEGATRVAYVGYSMRDPDVVKVLALSQFASRVHEHWVAPVTDPHVRQFVERDRRRPWEKAEQKSFKQRQLNITSDAFFEALAHSLAVGP